MKKLIRVSIKTYHLLFPSSVRVCRYDPTCSQYLVDAIEKYGTIRGIVKGISRLSTCHPYTKRSIIDPA